MNPGDRCICQEDDWHNAYGESDYTVYRGQRLTVVDSRRVGGLQFFSFEETPKNNFYLSYGFKPLRSYNA